MEQASNGARGADALLQDTALTADEEQPTGKTQEGNNTCK